MGRDFWVGVICISIIMIVSAAELILKYRLKKKIQKEQIEKLSSG